MRRARGIRRRAALAAPLALVMTLFVVADAAAATITVCPQRDACDFLTIKEGVGAAVDGDTIEVATGTYDEDVVVDKSVRLLGAQRNRDPRGGRRGAESIVTGSPAFTLNADRVTVDGFRIQESSLFGIATSATTSGHTIVNNLIRRNCGGILLNGAVDGAQTLVQHNRLERNNKPGNPECKGQGVVSTEGVSNVVIDENELIGHTRAAARFAAPPGFTSSGLLLSENRLVKDSGFGFQNALSVDVIDNVNIQPNRSNNPGGDDERNAQVYFGGEVKGAIVRGNRLSGHRDRPPGPPSRNGVLVDVQVDENGNPLLDPNEGIQVIGNTLVDHRAGVRIQRDEAMRGELRVEFNRIVRNRLAGIRNNDPDATELIDADNNWWGCNKGPNDNLGQCDRASPRVNFDPWLVLSIRAGEDRIDRIGGNTTIEASLRTNSAGNTPPSFFPDRTSIGFKTTRGRITKRAKTLEGVAHARLSATRRRGVAHVSAELDGERKRTRVEIR